MVDQKEGPAALGFRDYQLNTRTKNVKCKSLRKRVNLCIIHNFHVFKRDHLCCLTHKFSQSSITFPGKNVTKTQTWDESAK